MKTIIFVLIAFISYTAQAQSGAIQTQTFEVKGNCDDCKERIENAADIKGVKIVKWDPETKIATATFNSEKTSLEKIRQAIAKKGYDTGDLKGNEKAYNRLPQCCKYRDNKCEE